MFLLGRGDRHLRFPFGSTVKPLFLKVSEKGSKAVKVFHGVGVKLMVVAFGAPHGGSQPDVGGCPYPVCRILCQVFLVLSSSLGRDHMQPVKSGCDFLRLGCVWKQVSSYLFFCKLIKRHVLVECMDHVISEGPHGIGLISMVTNGVCVAHQIQPMDRKFFPEGWIGKEAIDHLRVICRILGFREMTCCLDRGWKSDEILVYATSKSCLVGRLGGADAP